MKAWIGDFGIVIALVAAMLLAWEGLGSLTSLRRADPKRLFRLAIALAAGAAIAMGALQWALISNDFSLEYVANNSAVATPLVFKVASAWAALEGSIVLWGLVLAGYIFASAWVYRRRGASDRMWSAALGVMAVVAIFFFALMLTIGNPFSVCTRAGVVGCAEASTWPAVEARAPVDGFGPNALLQNHILMAAHPPFLYLGYIGLTVPFGFAIAALLIGKGGPVWLERSRRATLSSWVFLTIGIVLGGLWSYEVLGWGGYWAWDPVENASLLPWLAATAFLHSSVVQRKRGVLQSWNFVLVISAFALTILGTFLTRSGVITSVHSFTRSAVGPALLWFLGFVLVASFGLFVTRSHLVADTPRLESAVSREGVFILNNLLLATFAVAVLTGTVYPLFVEAFTGDQIGVGRPFFDRMALPLSYALILAMGVGPITPYRTARPSVVWERLRTPVRLALAAGALLVLVGFRERFLILAVVTSTFVAAVIFRQLVVLSASAAGKKQTRASAAAWRLMRNDPHYWAGQLSHLGVALLALGIAISSTLSVERQVEMTVGETIEVAGHTLAFDGVFERREPARNVIGVVIDVARDGQSLERLEPRLNDYTDQNQTVATPAVRTTVAGDLYLSVDLIGADSLRMTVFWFPFLWLVWAGGLLTAVAGFLPMLPGARNRRVNEEQPKTLVNA